MDLRSSRRRLPFEPAVRELKPFKPTLQPPKASMSFMPPQKGAAGRRYQYHWHDLSHP
jgi:hypothetical protein